MDSDISMAKKVLEEANKSSLVTSVVSQNRFDPKILEMKKQMKINLIGEPFLCEVRMFWSRSLDYYSSGNGWRGKIGNVLINQGIHLIDIVIWFFGYPKRIESSIYKVKDNIECYDNAILTLQFEHNIWANMVFSTACSDSEPYGFRIYGTKGTLVYDADNIYSRKNQGIQFTNKLRQLFGNRFRLKVEKSLLQLQIENFIDSIINKTTPAVSLKEAYDTLSVIKKCEKDSCYSFSDYS
mgnify:FL=1